MPNIPTAIQRYGLAVVSVALALLLALLLQHYKFPHGVLSVFLFAIALTAWHAGVGPAALSIVLSSLCFDYFFLLPIYSFAFGVSDAPAIMILVCFAVLITRFSAVRRRVEGHLLQARDELQKDIEDRKQAEQALMRSEAYLAEAQRIAHVGYWERDLEPDRMTWSDETYRIFGLQPQERPINSAVFQELIHPEDREMVTHAVEQAWGGGAPYNVEYRVIWPSGEVRIVHSQGNETRYESGRPHRMFGTVQDITERKRAEQDLRRNQAYLAEAQRLTKTGSWAWSPVIRDRLYWSEEMFRIFGLDPQQGPVTDEAFWERVHPEDRDSMYELRRKVALEKTEYEHDHRIVLPDGTVKHIHAIGHPVFNRAGDVVEFVGTAVDVTERKRAEEGRERMRQLEADLAHMDRVTTLGELVASLAHELNQPITAAITNANTSLRWLARDEPDLEEARQALMRIVKDGTRAAEIINGLRSFYKKAAPNERELVDVNEVAREMLVLLHGEASRYSIATRTELAPELPRVMADRVQLQQVFMNLMLNAIEAMKETAGELTIKSQLDKGGQLLITVSDTGAGLPADKADQIFNAFFTTKPQGSGMGLAITRSIIEAHGGRLWASANTGRGATFHFTLPSEATASSTSAG